MRISTYPVATTDVTIRHGLPATTVERTIADLVADRIDLSLVAKALGDAMRNGSVDLASLAHRLAPQWLPAMAARRATVRRCSIDCFT